MRIHLFEKGNGLLTGGVTSIIFLVAKLPSNRMAA
jgi:hypothetical protein